MRSRPFTMTTSVVRRFRMSSVGSSPRRTRSATLPSSMVPIASPRPEGFRGEARGASDRLKRPEPGVGQLLDLDEKAQPVRDDRRVRARNDPPASLRDSLHGLEDRRHDFLGALQVVRQRRLTERNLRPRREEEVEAPIVEHVGLAGERQAPARRKSERSA